MKSSWRPRSQARAGLGRDLLQDSIHLTDEPTAISPVREELQQSHAAQKAQKLARRFIKRGRRWTLNCIGRDLSVEDKASICPMPSKSASVLLDCNKLCVDTNLTVSSKALRCTSATEIEPADSLSQSSTSVSSSISETEEEWMADMTKMSGEEEEEVGIMYGDELVRHDCGTAAEAPQHGLGSSLYNSSARLAEHIQRRANNERLAELIAKREHIIAASSGSSWMRLQLSRFTTTSHQSLE